LRTVANPEHRTIAERGCQLGDPLIVRRREKVRWEIVLCPQRRRQTQGNHLAVNQETGAGWDECGNRLYVTRSASIVIEVATQPPEQQTLTPHPGAQQRNARHPAPAPRYVLTEESQTNACSRQ